MNSDKNTQERTKVLVVGAGLAGSEASYFLARQGIQVCLVESKVITSNPAQKSKHFAELVCTNSLKSLDPSTGHGLLKEEMKVLGSLVLEVAHEFRVPAGEALAVDREKFSLAITNKLKQHPNISIIDQEVSNPLELAQKLNCHFIIVASGPLTTKSLEEWIVHEISNDDCYFYDAIAPVVDADTLDYTKLYYKDRWKDNEEHADYLNAPMNKEQYFQFIEELVKAEKILPKDFESPKFFESCLPIDVMAERGKETARFSCMKPIGLKMKDGTMPFAVVQLRKENLLGTAFNLVGFQTRLTYKDQVRIFRMIPGLENASFIHLGSVHRNTFLNSKKLLNFDYSSKKYPHLHFAGQITGVEGYTESAACGLYVAYQILRKIKGKDACPFPITSCIGALVNYTMTVEKPMPSNINFGLFPAVELLPNERKGKDRKAIRKERIIEIARKDFNLFMESNPC